MALLFLMSAALIHPVRRHWLSCLICKAFGMTLRAGLRSEDGCFPITVLGWRLGGFTTLSGGCAVPVHHLAMGAPHCFGGQEE